MLPRFSVVIPSLNQGRYIEDALKSLSLQRYPGLEIIVMDGGSEDETLDVLKRWESRLSYWESEKDNGQSDALNKGFSRCSGDYLFWINSDDIILPGALSRAADKILSTKASWVVGGCAWIDSAGAVVKCSLGENPVDFLPSLGFLHVYGPTSFFTRAAFEECGGFDESLHYVMDADLWWRFWRKGLSRVRVPGYLWGFRIHEESKTSSHLFSKSKDDVGMRHFAKQRAEREVLKSRYRVNRLMINAARGLRLLEGRYLRAGLDGLRFRGRRWDLVDWSSLVRNR